MKEKKNEERKMGKINGWRKNTRKNFSLSLSLSQEGKRIDLLEKGNRKKETKRREE